MKTNQYTSKHLKKYLLGAFIIAWIIQIAVWLLYQNNQAMFGQLLMVILMFAPLVATLIAGVKLKGMGWKPKLKGNILVLLFSWFAPWVLTFIGIVIYFVIFRNQLDFSGESMIASLGEQGEAFAKALESQGITYPMYVAINVIAAMLYTPFLNMFAAIGEEAGWRGFMYPMLKEKYGIAKGSILGGIIWGIWHWPLIGLIGFEYGTEYFGFPITGMLMFVLFTIPLGILCDWVYVKSECIWFPAILHGSINAAATIPVLVCRNDIGTYRLLGPVPNGLIAGMPLIIISILILIKTSKDSQCDEV